MGEPQFFFKVFLGGGGGNIFVELGEGGLGGGASFFWLFCFKIPKRPKGGKAGGGEKKNFLFHVNFWKCFSFYSKGGGRGGDINRFFSFFMGVRYKKKKGVREVKKLFYFGFSSGLIFKVMGTIKINVTWFFAFFKPPGGVRRIFFFFPFIFGGMGTFGIRGKRVFCQ